MPLYHFTDTVRLPWIVLNKKLRPGRNKLGGFPEPEFIWASTDPHDDGSASMHRGECYRLSAPYSLHPAAGPVHPMGRGAIALSVSWTADQVQRLQQSAAGKRTLPGNWWCRAEPLPLTRIPADCWHWRSYRSNRWTEMPGPNVLITDHWPALAIRIGDYCFASMQHDGSRGEQGYEVLEASMKIFEKG